MRRLPSLRGRGSGGWAEGAFWSGAVAIAHRPSSRGAAAQRRIIAPRFTSLEAGRNDALHNEIDALTCRPKQGAGRDSDRTHGHSMIYHAFAKIGRASCRAREWLYG